MGSVIVRAASVEDISSIVKVRLQAFRNEEISGFSAPEFSIFTSTKRLHQGWHRENLLKDGFSVFVAEEEMKIVGFIVFKMVGGYGYVDNICVAKEKQRRGIGKALVAYVEEITKSNGCDLIKTDTTENAEGIPWKSYSFWTSMGYKDTGERMTNPYGFKEIPFIKKL